MVDVDIYNNDASYVDRLTVVGDRLFFRSSYYNQNFSAYRPLYSIDTSTGHAVQLDGVQYVDNLTAIGNALVFSAYSDATGYELWRVSAGSTTPAVLDIVSGTGSSSPSQFTSVNGTLFFTATGSDTGVELWKLDGSGNPVLVKDIRSGGSGSSPNQLFAFNNRLYWENLRYIWAKATALCNDRQISRWINS
jgi:ELWxxDGT repeat protein